MTTDSKKKCTVCGKPGAEELCDVVICNTCATSLNEREWGRQSVVVNMIDETIGSYQREIESGVGYINHSIRTEYKSFIKTLKKVKNAINREENR